MKLKNVLAVTILAALGALVGDSQIKTITVRAGGSSVLITLADVSLTCAATYLFPGQTTTCTVTLNASAGTGGYTIPGYSVDAPLVLSPLTLVVPEGAKTATFTVSRP